MIVTSDHQPAAHLRMIDIAVFSHGYEEEREQQQRSRWDRFVDATRAAYRRGELDLSQQAVLSTLNDAMLDFIGRPGLLALSYDYRLEGRFDAIVEQTQDQILEQLRRGIDLSKALAAFGADEAIRIMSIHKSKGLEFDTVILFAVEKETYWASPEEERSLFFVGASRAKERLLLTASASRPRPPGTRVRWNEARHPHPEFLGYCEP